MKEQYGAAMHVLLLSEVFGWIDTKQIAWSILSWSYSEAT